MIVGPVLFSPPLTLDAGQDTPGKALCQYLDGIPKYVSILKKKDFDNIFNN